MKNQNRLNTQSTQQAMLKQACENLLIKAKAHGAEQAEVISLSGRSLSVSVRENKLEDLDASEGLDIGLRVIIDNKQACVSGSDLANDALDKLAERCVAMAKLAPLNPYCGLATPEQLATNPVDLDVFDESELDAEALLERAIILERTALSVDKIIQAEGSSASMSKTNIWFATSNGFMGGWRASRHSLSVAAFASDGKSMERDYDYKTTRWLQDLPSPEDIALKAANRARARLGASKIKSSQMPVLLEKRVATQILSCFISAISGAAIARGVSFLKDKMDKQIFASNIQIIDNPYLKKGLGSRPWDGEGIAGKKLEIIKDGVLKTWLLNLASARQLELDSNGCATRSISSPPSIGPSNIWISAGEKSPEQMMKEIGDGLLVTEMFGPSFNPNTGDYSVGVAGFEIRNGQKSAPVNEITIAANMLDMFKTMQVANDLTIDKASSSPSLLIENMVVAGE